jgi:8-oxo-dGTP pyrophosphatase MutT (NUDIX family)
MENISDQNEFKEDVSASRGPERKHNEQRDGESHSSLNETPVVSQFQKHFCESRCCTFYQRKEYPNVKRLTHKDFSRYNQQPRTAAGIIGMNDNNQVVLVQSHFSKWGFPKGGQDKNESLVNCAIREMKEETSIEIDPRDVLFNSPTIVTHDSKKQNKRTISLFKLSQNSPLDDSAIRLDDIHSDITGIGFFHVPCVLKLDEKKQLRLNYHTRSTFLSRSWARQHHQARSPSKYSRNVRRYCVGSWDGFRNSEDWSFSKTTLVFPNSNFNSLSKTLQSL